MVPDRFRLRVAYGKRDRLRYLGHLEVLATIDRCVRRARLPFAVSEGFTPRMRINFTSALPVGCASDEEYYDLLLTSYVPAHEALARLVAATPGDLAPYAAAYVAWEEPALEALLVRSEWLLVLRPLAADVALAPEALERAIAGLASAGMLEYQRGRKTKRVDLGATLLGYATRAGRDGSCELALTTRVGSGASLRPDLLANCALDALGIERSSVVIMPTRLAQVGEGEQGAALHALPEGAARVALP